MNQEILTNNITVSGTVKSGPEHSHCVYGEDFYSFILEVERLSGAVDELPCIVPKRLLSCIGEGKMIEACGQIRSYNRIVEGCNRLDIKLFLREVYPVVETSCINEVILRGYVCKPPVYRVTPFGREITDMLLAVNRAYNKSDYIPIIVWGRTARMCGKLNVGEKLYISGRLQSREYEKNVDGEIIKRMAYEVSACTAEVITQ